MPAAPSRPNGAQPSRAETEAFRASLVARIVDSAFRLDDGELPRTRGDFDRMLAAGASRLDPAARVFADGLAPVTAELDKTLAALRSASRHPSGRAAVLDVYAQLEHLVPPDLVEWVPLARLGHYPRYLRAAQARLQRAINDPRKDGDKHAPFAPLWAKFLERRASATDREAVDDLRWAFEELRVAIFAPELKTPVPVSIAKVQAALASLK
jgi:ATP-dependent helicase HrpA